MIEALVGERKLLRPRRDDLDWHRCFVAARQEAAAVRCIGLDNDDLLGRAIARNIEPGSRTDLEHTAVQSTNEPIAPLAEAPAFEPAVQRVVDPLFQVSTTPA